MMMITLIISIIDRYQSSALEGAGPRANANSDWSQKNILWPADCFRFQLLKHVQKGTDSRGMMKQKWKSRSDVSWIQILHCHNAQKLGTQFRELQYGRCHSLQMAAFSIPCKSSGLCFRLSVSLRLLDLTSWILSVTAYNNKPLPSPWHWECWHVWRSLSFRVGSETKWSNWINAGHELELGLSAKTCLLAFTGARETTHIAGRWYCNMIALRIPDERLLLVPSIALAVAFPASLCLGCKFRKENPGLEGNL